MNETKVQEIIIQAIEENKARIGGKAHRNQYAAGKKQQAELQELGILHLMPAKFGFSDADAVIRAAKMSAGAAFNAAGEGDESAAHPLYVAINEVDQQPEPVKSVAAPVIRKGAKVRVLNHTAYQHLSNGAVINPLIAHDREGYETTIRAIYREEMEDEHGNDVIETIIEVETGETFSPDQIEAIE